MSNRYRSDPEAINYEEKRSGCSMFLHYTWKTITCLFSHLTLISLVVSYCYLGAVIFENLEVDHELEVKKTIKHIRENTTEHLWNFTQEMKALKEENFTPEATQLIKEFENSLLKAMTKDGWDGTEEPEHVQWTRSGALFYSIVVITTIGYGHITPKTNWGKVVTIFYAIMGIPLMLLCLSNIGDVMATSFRFLYWRVCCYVCQKKPKKRERGRSFRASSRNEYSLKRSKNSFRRSVRSSGKADSGHGNSYGKPVYHSDTELRYPDEFSPSGSIYSKAASLHKRPSQYSETTFSKKSTASQKSEGSNSYSRRGGSLDRHNANNKQNPNEIVIDPMVLDKTSILFNKYVVGKDEALANNAPGITLRKMEWQLRTAKKSETRSKTSKFLAPPSDWSPESSDKEEDIDSQKNRPRMKTGRSKSGQSNPSPRMMTPLGYGHRNKYLDDPDSDDYDDYSNYYDVGEREKSKPVPIWLCVLLVISYILAGAYLFKYWEDWNYLDAAYFCFITLTTIGFGDLVPGKDFDAGEKNSDKAHASIALCSLYILFGISLLAMSFNLVQEEVISNVRSIAMTLGIIRSESDESEDED